MTEINTILKQEIEFMFGRPVVSSRDCIQLSDDIFRVTRARLNQNTLRRLFGIVKTSYAPAGSTLQILANYCGFRSIDELRQYKQNYSREADSPREANLLNFLVNLFRNTPVSQESTETFKSVAEQTILFLERQPLLLEQFQPMVAKTRNGQDYYFMGISHIDRLNSEFGNGLRYFLKERTDTEAQVLALSLLVFKGWLTENEQDVHLNLSEMKMLEPPAAHWYMASGRYFASLLYEAEIKNNSTSDIFRSIQRYDAAMDDLPLKAQIDFELIITESLILTKNADEGMYYADLISKKLPSLEQPCGYISQHIDLLKALTMYRAGEFKNAQLLLRFISPALFDFRNKKMLTIIYGLLSGKLNKQMQETGSPILLLIKETGFTRLQKLVQ